MWESDRSIPSLAGGGRGEGTVDGSKSQRGASHEEVPVTKVKRSLASVGLEMAPAHPSTGTGEALNEWTGEEEREQGQWTLTQGSGAQAPQCKVTRRDTLPALHTRLVSLSKVI